MEIPPPKEVKLLDKSKQIKKEKGKVTSCEHVEAEFYAHGLCRNCYHTKGRQKMASECQHKDRKLYARNVCKACYLKAFRNG